MALHLAAARPDLALMALCTCAFTYVFEVHGTMCYSKRWVFTIKAKILYKTYYIMLQIWCYLTTVSCWENFCLAKQVFMHVWGSSVFMIVIWLCLVHILPVLFCLRSFSFCFLFSLLHVFYPGTFEARSHNKKQVQHFFRRSNLTY